MGYQLLADLVVLTHLGFIVFAALGGLLALRWRRLVWLHLPTVAWGTFAEMSGTICPLTPLEYSLRTAAGQEGYEGDFIEHYLLPIIYPAGLTPAIQMILGIFLLVLNAVIYLAVWRRWTSPQSPDPRA